MKYISTRATAESLDFKGVTLTGLARDGGLYVPQEVPQLSLDEIRGFRGRPYHEVAFDVLKPFIGEAISEHDFSVLLKETYGNAFRHAATAPLTQIDSNEWILELFHGPTLAFKDFALQLLGRFFDTFTGSSEKPLTILGATSGDTGSAAIEACRGRENVTIYMLHPHGRVSDVQRRQMTTVLEPNVINIAIEGTFDDCQALVKTCFNDLAFRDQVSLTAVNSINWARVAAQIVYYFTSAVALGAPDRAVSYSVPTGNFGDIFAGYIAKKMGLPIDQLVIATNSNDILTRTLETGRYAQSTVQATTSPSMDIQVSSNFERLLFDLTGRDGARVAALMNDFVQNGYFELSEMELSHLRKHFRATRVTDDLVKETIANVKQTSGYLLDPHTAVGVYAARHCLKAKTAACVTLATAHPVKFGDAVEAAVGVKAELPLHMADLFERDERMEVLANDATQLKARILKGN